MPQSGSSRVHWDVKVVRSFSSRQRNDENQTGQVIVELIDRDNDHWAGPGLLVSNRGVKLCLPDFAESRKLPNLHLRIALKLRFRLQPINGGHVPSRDLGPPQRVLGRICRDCRI